MIVEASNAGIVALVINPGEWFGKTWLIQVTCEMAPKSFVVEAGTVSDAIDVFSESEHGHYIHVPDFSLGDYPEGLRGYDSHGRVIDTDWLEITGIENSELPWPCRYFGENLPKEGLDPRIYEDYTGWLEDNPHVALTKREEAAGVRQLTTIRRFPEPFSLQIYSGDGK